MKFSIKIFHLRNLAVLCRFHKSCFGNVCKRRRKTPVQESLFNIVSVPAFLIKMAMAMMSG